MQRYFIGPLLVILGASLWATDTLFRFPLIQKLQAEQIVFIEHLIAFIFILPFFLSDREKFKTINQAQWLGLTIVGIFGSAVSTILFTKSFLLIHPSVAILLQKLQPLIVALLAFLFLKERFSASFFLWAPLALVAAMILSFPNFEFLNWQQFKNSPWEGTLFAVSAASLWALATVFGKSLLKSIAPTVVTFWRFWFGLCFLIALQFFTFNPEMVPVFQNLSVWKSLAAMALIPGLIAVWLYYQGLQRTQATVTSFLELIFPIAATVINTYFLDLPLTMTQLLAGALLLIAMIGINASQRRNKPIQKDSSSHQEDSKNEVEYPSKRSDEKTDLIDSDQASSSTSSSPVAPG